MGEERGRDNDGVFAIYTPEQVQSYWEGTKEYRQWRIQSRMAKSKRSFFISTKCFPETCGKCMFVIGVILLALLGLAACCSVPVTMIWIGSTYLSDCPLEPGIPAFLIAGGVNGLLLVLWISLFFAFSKYRGDFSKTIAGILAGVNIVISLAWVIAGDVVVYRSRELHNDDPTSENYCHPTLYLFAFWLLVIINSFAGLCFVGGGCVISCGN